MKRLTGLTLALLLAATLAACDSVPEQGTTTPAPPTATATPQQGNPNPTATPPAPTCPSCPIPPAPTATPVPQATTTPAPPAPAGASCIPTSLVSGWVKGGAGVGSLINSLNQAFEQQKGTVGETHEVSGFQINNLGPAGAVVVWTDTAHNEFTMVDSSKPVHLNVFKVKTQGSWGTYVVFAPVIVPSPGRLARLCDPIKDLQQVFPGAVSALHP